MEEVQGIVQEQASCRLILHSCTYVSRHDSESMLFQLLNVYSTTAKSEPSKEESKPEAPKTTTEPPGQSDADRRLEKARAIFKKYDFEFSDEDWQASETRPKAPRERVQKPIRMRVKYTCHNCKTVYGHDRICVSCQHKRCPECIRYPPKKKKGKAPADKTADAPTTASKGCTCHECQSGFDLGAVECPNCKHQICDKCTKEAKLDPPPTEASSQPVAAS